jgi:hypothetical protein
VVGRELHTICPLGEDHQGDDRGGTTTDYGKYNNNAHGNTMLVWRSWTLMMISRRKVSCWTKIMANQGIVQMNSVLPV